MVERHLAKMNVASWNLVFRSNKKESIQRIGSFFVLHGDEMRTSRVRRSNTSAASGGCICEVRSTNNLLGTARSGQQIGERTVSRLPLQQKRTNPNGLVLFLFLYEDEMRTSRRAMIYHCRKFSIYIRRG